MAQNSAPGWDRWGGQYQQNQQYSAMETPGMMPYDPRASQQYAIPTTYAMPSVPAMAPVSSMPPSFVPYTPGTSPTSMVMPYRPYTEERSPLSETSHGLPTYHREPQQIYRQDRIPSPAIKRDPLPVGQMPLPAAPVQRNPAELAAATPKPYVGKTLIDEMMRGIQAQGDEEEDEEDEEEDEEDEEEEEEGTTSPKDYHTPCSIESRCSSPRSTRSKRRNSIKNNKEKRRCTWEGCKRTFTQGTHMRIHMRSHTGEKPYVCTWKGCHWTFSQHGNLKTHYRRHTGEKPYKCEQCSKEFAQKGNLRAHQSVHDPTKRFHCLIDGCGKPFTQRGNLKNHQNKFHKEAVLAYSEKFATTPRNELDDEDKKIFDHFKEIYAKMNQGIKGRGVGRTIQKKANTTSQAIHDMPMYRMQQHTPPMEHSVPHGFGQVPSYNPHALPAQHGLPQAPTWQGYPMPREQGYQAPMPVARPQYEVYEMEHHEPMSSSNASSVINTPTTSIYEEEQNRDLAFRDRY